MLFGKKKQLSLSSIVFEFKESFIKAYISLKRAHKLLSCRPNELAIVVL
jgi:hypothetical protein